jgi:NitT/TauT family transport system permease protein
MSDLLLRQRAHRPSTGTPSEPAALVPPRAAHAARRAGSLAVAVGLRSAAVVAFLLLWEVAPRIGLVDRVFLPPLSEVLATTRDLAVSGQLGEHVRASLVRAGSGFGIAVVAAIPLGLLIGWYRTVSTVLSPILEAFRNTAALALLPVFVLVLGIGETSKIALVAFASFFPILLNTIAGVRTVDPLLVRSARSLGLSPLRLFQKVILPSAVPTIFTGLRMAGAASVLVLVAAEMIGAQAGLGYLINAAQLNFQIPEMYAGILTISVIGIVVNYVLLAAERRFSRWRA